MSRFVAHLPRGAAQPTSAHQNTAVGPLWQNVRAVIHFFPRPEDSKMGRKRKSRIKPGRHKWRPAGHNCPQCGQFSGAHAGVKTQREHGAWGQKSQKHQYFKVFIGVTPKRRLKLKENKVKFALYLPPEKKAELEWALP